MSVQGAAAFLDGLAQPVAAGKVVVISEEAGIAVVSALDNVHLHTGQVYTGAAGHDAAKYCLIQLDNPPALPGPLNLYPRSQPGRPGREKPAGSLVGLAASGTAGAVGIKLTIIRI